ncbi:MAG: NACHT domain-containing protein [Okeania sp. SIO3B3]|nr:NACHT domain-containing protein [Okeania sp. SIO3B3]
MNHIKQYLEASKNKTEKLLRDNTSQLYPFSRSFENISTNNQNFQQKNPTEDYLNQYNGQLLIQGEPGGGKTISLIKLAEKKIKEQIQQNTSDIFLPIFAEIYTWKDIYEDPKRENTIVNWLVEKTELEQQTLEQKIKERKILLLLDGLDELPFNISKDPDNPNAPLQDYRVEFINQLNKFIKDTNQEITVIITCRRRDYEDIIKNNHDYEFKFTDKLLLRRLKIEEIEDYLKERLEEKSFQKLLYLIKINQAISKIIRTPFLLEILLSVYQENEKNTESTKLRYVSNVEQLFDEFIKQGYNREKNKLEDKKEVDFPYSAQEFQTKLGEIAVVMMSDDTPDDNEISQQIFQKVIPEEQKRNQFIELARNIQLLFEKDQQKYLYEFRHNLLRDYLTFQCSKEFLRHQQENNSITKKEVVRALGKIDNQKAIELLKDLLLSQKEDKDIRYEAANSIGQFSSTIRFEGYEETFGKECINNYFIDKINRYDIEEYFKQFVPQKLIDDFADIDNIYKFSQGIPLVVNLIALQWYDGVPLQEIIQSGGYSHAQIIEKTCEQFLVHVRNKQKNQQNYEDLRIIYLLTIMRRYDRDFLQEIIGREEELNLSNLGQRLNNQYSFISPKLTLQDNYKFYFKKYLLTKKNNDELLRKLCSDAQNYCEKQFFSKNNFNLYSLNTTATSWIDSQENREIISDWIYYWFWKDEKQGWYYAIPHLVQGWYYNTSWTHSILDTIDNNKQFISTRKSQELLRLFRSGVELSKQYVNTTNDRSNLLDELEQRADKVIDNKEWLSIIYLKRGDLLFENKEYEQAKKIYEQAKICAPLDANSLREKLTWLLKKVEIQIKKEQEKQDKQTKLIEVVENLVLTINDKQEVYRHSELLKSTSQKEPLMPTLQPKTTETEVVNSQLLEDQKNKLQLEKESQLSSRELLIRFGGFFIGYLFGQNGVNLYLIILILVVWFVFQVTNSEERSKVGKMIVELFNRLSSKNQNDN